MRLSRYTRLLDEAWQQGYGSGRTGDHHPLLVYGCHEDKHVRRLRIAGYEQGKTDRQVRLRKLAAELAALEQEPTTPDA